MTVIELRDNGSDCPSGKVQYTKAAARERARWERAHGHHGVQDYRCDLCGTHHVGNRRRSDKKSTMQRRRK